MGGEQRFSNQMTVTMPQRGTSADICIQIPRFPDPDSRAQHAEYRVCRTEYMMTNHHHV